MNSPLTSFERRALALMGATNQSRVGRFLQTSWLDTLIYPFVRAGISRRLYVAGGEWLRDNEVDRGILLASNHRSFFDQWPLLLTLWKRPWVEKLCFPVRSNFFYDTATGVAINFAMSGGSMYPPVFRDPAKQEFNKTAVETIVEFLRKPGHIVGMHPEGTRNKGPDPYDLLPAQPGIGQMTLQAKPIVIPVFTNGLTNDFVQTIRTSYSKRARREDPVIIVIGDPVDYSDYAEKKPRVALYKRCADRIRNAIIELGEQEKEIRARCAAGEISDDDPHWFRD